MPERNRIAEMESWLAAVRSHFAQAEPALLYLYDIYAAEALFGRRFIAPELERLAPGARVLEVGAGSMLLSCQLVREGYEVTALEPTGDGFGHFARMRQVVLEQAGAQGCLPRILDTTAEALAIEDHFDHAFSINVMEHVQDVELSMRNVAASLRLGGHYHFTCPNYLFPYEPHFNIPTLFSKQLTERVLHRRILGRSDIPDPKGLWESLNWISVASLRRSARRLQGLKITFGTELIAAAFERMQSDQSFASRRSPAMRRIVGWIVRLRLHRMIALAPALIQPLVDCRVERVAPPVGARSAA